MSTFFTVINFFSLLIPFQAWADIHTTLQVFQKQTYLEFSVTIKNSEKTTEMFLLPSQAEILKMTHAQQERLSGDLRRIKIPANTQSLIQYRILYDSHKFYFLSSPEELWHPVRVTQDYFSQQKKEKSRKTASRQQGPVETFSVETTLLPGFELIHSATGVSQPDLSYVFGRFKSYLGKDTRIKIYLMKSDESLTKILIEHLERYLKHFENLYGTYPYDYFAVVESPDEIGYAFPKMTWIGTRLLRFPFILKTSLPHELLHSWWGNSVFVDYDSGNWCEGLTAFGSDYGLLDPEEKKIYRLKAITNYLNYTKDDKEISLADFISRGEDRSLQAIGYDKSMMVFVMLEQILGEKDFHQGLRNFYQRYKYQAASWQDIFNVLAQTSQRDLKAFKYHWIDSKGLINKDFIQLLLEQKDQKSTVVVKANPTELMKIPGAKVDVSIQFPSGPQSFQLLVSKSQVEVETPSFTYQEKPLFYTLDPQFYLFRELSDFERPVTFSKFFGSSEALLMLKNDEWSDSFQQVFADKTWKKIDSLHDFHKDQMIVVSLKEAFSHALVKESLTKRKIRMTGDSFYIEGHSFSLQSHSVFMTVRIQNTFVTLVHFGQGLSPVRWLERWSRYGAQGYVVLNATSAAWQGLWLDPFEIPFK